MEPDTLQDDAKALLDRLGSDVWEKYGASGWGADGTKSFFAPNIDDQTRHSSGAEDTFQQYYAERDLYDRVLKFYQQDYDNPKLGLAVPDPPPAR